MGGNSISCASISYTSGSINFTKLHTMKFIIWFTPLLLHLHYVNIAQFTHSDNWILCRTTFFDSSINLPQQSTDNISKWIVASSISVVVKLAYPKVLLGLGFVKSAPFFLHPLFLLCNRAKSHLQSYVAIQKVNHDAISNAQRFHTLSLYLEG